MIGPESLEEHCETASSNRVVVNFTTTGGKLAGPITWTVEVSFGSEVPSQQQPTLAGLEDMIGHMIFTT